MKTTRRLVAAPILVLLAGILFAACGGGGGGSGGSAFVPPKGPSTETITVHAGNFYFKPDTITAKPGIATINLVVDQNIHDFVFDGAYSGFQIEGESGSSESKKIDLKPGKYTFYCSIPGHRAAGMVGTLTVK